ncbi:MAG: hypothetical protein KDH84_06790, partial [Calditrichaeota bacterium]|nr:hypothetical protein [Calditrichota bacterium]
FVQCAILTLNPFTDQPIHLVNAADAVKYTSLFANFHPNIGKVRQNKRRRKCAAPFVLVKNEFMSLAPAGASQVNTGRQAGAINPTRRSEPRQGRSQADAASMGRSQY